MSKRTHFRHLTLPLILALVPACGPEAAPPRPAPQAANAETVDDGALGPDDVVQPPSTEQRKKDAEDAHERGMKQREEWDRHARGYLDSFKRRVYEPARDGRLDYAEATVTAQVGDATAQFQVSFDGGRAVNDRVRVTPADDPPGMPRGTARSVLRWASHSLNGAYRTVAFYVPRIQLSLIRSNEKGERLIVYCPPQKADFSVSYSFDERELIMIRGTNGNDAKEITHYEWEFVRGRYLLDKLWFFGIESEMEFTYGQHAGVILADEVRYRKDEDRVTLAFDYSRVETRPAPLRPRPANDSGPGANPKKRK